MVNKRNPLPLKEEGSNVGYLTTLNLFLRFSRRRCSHQDLRENLPGVHRLQGEKGPFPRKRYEMGIPTSTARPNAK